MSDPVEKMDDDRLKALLSQEISSSLTYDKTELAQKRAKNLEYLRGEMNDTPAMAGRSSVVSMDVADTIGWMLPDRILHQQPELRQALASKLNVSAAVKRLTLALRSRSQRSTRRSIPPAGFPRRIPCNP